ncbi:MAG TPA: bifunctional 4-hydroxy-2-oxoglutarate aldolase/2-dehydro-3-deoxy-phosphogluconate aldolase [Armatimonadota bacterium]|jgi:2-dehydro-3-deoxyphosphogluconate aldolase/(4S)-4-hydroxy-2-oxoglutarate aldolase
MLSRKESMERIKSAKLVAVLRHAELEQVSRAVAALLAGGVDCIEVPISTHAGIMALPRLKDEFGDRICLGAGSVFNADLATLAVGMDVDFISAPGSDIAIVEVCKARNVLSFPGAMTPTEIIRAWHVGADLIKVFPADLLTPNYFRNMLTQVPSISIAAAGGVDANNLADFLEAGACAAVVGRGLVEESMLQAGDFAAVTSRAQSLCSVLEGAS